MQRCRLRFLILSDSAIFSAFLMMAPQYVSGVSLEKARAAVVPITEYDKHTSTFIDGAFPVATRRKPGLIAESALELIGNTPMVRLSRLAKRHGIECDLVAKCEFLSVGGSVKDRIGRQMVEEAELKGRIKPGDALVEASSGNTGIAMALVSAVKGYRAIVTMPNKMSQEKQDVMVRLGAQVIRTPNSAPWNSLDSHIGLAHQLQATLPRCHLLDQYVNEGNPRCHYDGTALEVLEQCEGKIDVFVATAGTGGTLTGCAKRLKREVPNCRIVGVDPEGSILAEPESLNERNRGVAYAVEGIGYDFVPSTLDRSLVDEWLKVTDDQSFAAARELILSEGLLVGGSSGSALAAALEVCKGLRAGQRCVVLLPDSCRNYMNKFMSDRWMIEKGFIAEESPNLFSKKVDKDLPNADVLYFDGVKEKEGRLAAVTHE